MTGGACGLRNNHARYDSLNRLVDAYTTGPQWGQHFVYDGFGNLSQEQVTKGSAPALSLPIDVTTNRVATFQYDLNGNLTNFPNSSGFNVLSYDIENRLVLAEKGNDEWEAYSYASDNTRIWKKEHTQPDQSTEHVYFYGGGRKLGTYRIRENQPGLGGRLIHNGTGVGVDRLGSVGGPVKYFPYGQERTWTAQDTEKFGTYHRDATNLDYAMNRFYSSQVGRFLTADPYLASGGTTEPQSWNRYVYVGSDPTNRSDPSGRFALTAEYCAQFPRTAMATSTSPGWRARPGSTWALCAGELGAAVEDRCHRVRLAPSWHPTHSAMFRASFRSSRLRPDVGS